MNPVSTDDFDDLLTLWSDEDFTRHVMGRALGREEVWFRLLRDLGHWAAMGHGNWTIRLRDGGAYLGSVGVFDYRRELEPPFDAPELGWGVAPGFQGRGYAAEALTAALDWTDRRLEGGNRLHDLAREPGLAEAGGAGRLSPLCECDLQGSAGSAVRKPPPRAVGRH